ncbi:DNA cytosine methyltransferase [Campylobacter sp. RM12637]|uniref:DNA cytosine methyltransferase n=1 Tax=Campylobacter sp. RM12637 TaxID=2735734 RepID=UPI003014AF72|nr:DNA (cytosine-5-)-methyltransferase [Campylobacter sp. RM12637]
MRILDLFSGIGGISLGFASANFSEYDFSLKPNEQKAKNDGFFKTIAFCEIEPFCKKILAKNYPNTKIYDDVKTLPLNELRGGVNIITGGFPCQDLSVAGKQAGLKGERSGLFYEMLRIARELKPSYIFFENVPQLLHKGEIFYEFDTKVRESGYEYKAFILSAKECAYLHERKRAFIIAYPAGKRLLVSSAFWKQVGVKSIREQKTEEIINFALNLHKDFKKATERTRAFSDTYTKVRTNDGLSVELDRIKALGNAVVPEVVSIFARAIKENERLKEVKMT